MSGIEQVSPFSAMSQAKDLTTQTNGVQPAMSFESYLRAVNNRIDDKENKLITDYKTSTIERPKPYQDNNARPNNIANEKSYREKNNLDNRKDYNQLLASNDTRKPAVTNERKDYSNDDNKNIANPYNINNATQQGNNLAINNSNNLNPNNKSKNLADGSESSKEPADKKIVLGNNLNPTQIPTDKLASGEELIEALVTNQSNDVALEDNFILASVVYKLYNLINSSETGSATQSDTTEGAVNIKTPSMKEVMDMVTSLPASDLAKLSKLLNVEEPGISEKDKANLEAIKNILSANNKQIVGLDDEIKNQENMPKVVDSKEQLPLADAPKKEVALPTLNDKNVNPENKVVYDYVKYNKETAPVEIEEMLNKTVPGMADVEEVKAATKGTIMQLVEDLRVEKYKELLKFLRDKQAVEEAAKTATNGNTESTTAPATDVLVDDVLAADEETVTLTLAKTETQKLPAPDGMSQSSFDELVSKLSNLLSLGLSDEEIISIMKADKEAPLIPIFLADGEIAVDEKVQAVMGETKKVTYDDVQKNLLTKQTEILNEKQTKAVQESVKQTKEVTPQQTVEVKQQVVKAEPLPDLTKIYNNLKLQIEKMIKADSGATQPAANTQNNNNGNMNNQQQSNSSLLTSDITKFASTSSSTTNKVDSMLNDFNTLLKQQTEAKFDNKEVSSQRQVFDLKEPKDIFRLVKTLEQTAAKGESKLSISLTPENLGKLEIRLVEVGGKLTAKFFTENETSHKMMLTQAEAIRSQLSDKGIVIDNMEFAFNDSSSKEGKAHDQRKSAKNSNSNKEDQDGTLERNNNLNFRAKAQARGGLYA